MVNRAIVRVVTAGTLTEEALLDSRARQLAGRGGEVGRALRHRRRRHLDRPLRARLGAAPARSTPSWRGSAPAEIDRARAAGRRASCGRAGFDSLAAERRLKERFGVATLDGFGQFDRAALCAAGGLLAYLDEVARDSLPFLRPPVALRVGRSYDDRRGDAREPRADRRRRPATRAGSLLAAVDRTVTGAGARLLAADLGAPLLDRRADRGAARSGRLVRATTPALRELAARGSCARCPTSAARSAGWSPGAAARATSASCATASTRRGGSTTGWRGSAEPPALLAALLPALTGHGALVDLLVARAGAVAADRRGAGRLYRRRL